MYKTILPIVNSICLAIVSLVLSIMIPAFFMPFYTHEYAKNDTYNTVSMEKDDLMTVTQHMLSYLAGNTDELNIETRVGGQERLFFSDIEIYHMKDVKGLFTLAFAVGRAAFAAAALSASFMVLKGFVNRLFKWWRIVAATVFFTLLSLALVISVNFDKAFELFHEVFFSNDLWRLDQRVDLLVNIVPTPFFIDIAIFVGGLFAGFLGVMFVLGTIGGRSKV